MSSDFIYAIDFGTSNSLLAYANASQGFEPLQLDPSAQDPSILRSLIYFSEDLDVFFGQEAIHEFINEDGAGRFLRSIKKYLPQKSFNGTRIGNKHYSLENLIARFLKEMKRRADHTLQQDVRSLVLGRPALFSLDETEEKLAEERLYKAAQEAGFHHIEFLPEPIAAAYDYRKTILSEKIILVVDLGGGTSDFTVVKVHPGAFQPQDVLSIGGTPTAGNALDSRIMSQLIAPHFGTEVQYKLPFSTSIKQMPSSLKYEICSPADITLLSHSNIHYFLESVRKSGLSEENQKKIDQLLHLIDANLGFQIFEEIEKSKVGLCHTKEHHLFSFDDDPIHVKEDISYKQFQEITQEQISLILSSMDQVIQNAGIQPTDIDLICCTGGTSKVPAIADGLYARFGKDKIQSFKNFHSVISGLAEKGHELIKA